MTLEMGKPITQAKGEVELSAAIYEYYATTGPTLLADEELDIAGAGRAVVRTAPIGPLLGVMPWNFPYYQVARFVAPNLLLGNTDPAQACQQLPAAGAAHRRDHRRGRRTGRRLPERVRLHRPGRDDDREPACSRAFP